jgi:hypothetical protein
MQIAYPLAVDRNRHTGTVDEETHVRQMIEQLLFTTPGERVMRPTFGSGVLQLVFAPASPEMAATTQFLIEGALHQWLADRIELRGVAVSADDATLRVEVRYVLRRTQQEHVETFERSIG